MAISSEVQTALGQINEATGQVNQLVGDVSNSSDEQRNGIEQVTRAINELDTLTQSNSANSEQTASASENLKEQAITLLHVVRQLGQMAGVRIKEDGMLDHDRDSLEEVESPQMAELESPEKNLLN